MTDDNKKLLDLLQTLVKPDEGTMREIFERLGTIQAQLAAGSKRHDEFSREIREIREKFEPQPLIKDTVDKIKPIVDDYDQSRSKMAGVIMACTTIAGCIGFFASEIKKAVLGH